MHVSYKYVISALEILIFGIDEVYLMVINQLILRQLSCCSYQLTCLWCQDVRNKFFAVLMYYVIQHNIMVSGTADSCALCGPNLSITYLQYNQPSWAALLRLFALKYNV